MRRPQRHVVQTLEFEIRLPDEAGAADLHGLMSRLGTGRLATLLDRHCSKYSSPDRIDRIETLELNLGRLPAGFLESAFVERFEAALAERLPALIRAGGQSAPGSDRMHNPLMPSNYKYLDNSPSAPGSDRECTELELLAFFLQSGALPWWADSRRPGLPGKTLRYLIRHEPKRLHAVLLDLLKRLPVRKRLANQFDFAGFQALLRLLAPGLDREVRKAELLAPALARATGSPETQIRRQIREMQLVRAAAVSEQTGAAAAFFQHIAETYDLPAARLAELMRETMATSAGKIQTHWSRLIRQLLALSSERQNPYKSASAIPSDRPASEKTARQIGNERPGGAKLPENPAVKSGTSKPDSGQKPRREAPEPDLRFSESEDLFVDNAGLVVLGPFLPHFFRTAKLIRENEWTDETASHRGVALLHFLLTGRGDMPEYQTPLLKICCGIDPEAPLEYAEAPDERLQKECTNLLESVIAHAPVLGNMSPDGFRGTFLLRRGALGRRDGNWLVRVERQAYDVVLDRFPWSFRLIKLPWLRQLIAVEW